MLSKRKLMFTERRGFFRTSFNVVLEIPYNKLDEVAVEGSHRLTITDTEGGKHVFASFAEVSASIIEGDIKDLIKAS